MQLKRSKRQHQGLRTKSDYVPEDPSSQTSAIAQTAAALMFKKPSASPSPTTPKKPIVKTRPVVVKSVPHASPPKSLKPKYCIHSYATNKVININSNHKVTSAPSTRSNSYDVPGTSSEMKRLSSSSSKGPLRINTSSLQDHPGPSSAAIAAASLVAKSNPKSMIAIDSTRLKLKEGHDEEDQLSLKTPISRVASTRIESRRNSLASNISKSSPYSLIAVSQNNNSTGQLSFKDSHSSLQLHRLSISDANRSSSSIISPRDPHKSSIESLPLQQLPQQQQQLPLQTEVIPEHVEESDNIQQLSGLGVVVTLPTPMVGESVDSFSKQESLFAGSDTSSTPQDLKNNSTNSLLFNNDQHNQSSNDLSSASQVNKLLLKANHPYLAFFKDSYISPPGRNSPSPRFDNYLQFVNDKNFSNGSDISQLSDYMSNEKRKSSSLSGYKKQSDEFLYQSPLVSIKKSSIPDEDSTLKLNDTQQQQLLKRKPPPLLPVFDEPNLLMPPSSKTSKRLSLSSDFNIEDSPQFSTYSFTSSIDDPSKNLQKKTRKPPPPLSPVQTPMAFSEQNSYFNNKLYDDNNNDDDNDDDAGSYLQPPLKNSAYEGINESQLTFDEELSSINNDSSTLNESTSAFPKYPTYTSKEQHHHHPHLPMHNKTRKLKNNTRALFGRSKSSILVNQDPQDSDQLQYYLGSSDQSNANLNPATTSQTAILIPPQTVKLRSTMRKDKKSKEFNVDKPWKHHNDKYAISEHERKRYEGVWVANRDLCMDLKPQVQSNEAEDSLKAAQTVAVSQKLLNQQQLMHGIIVREIFKRSRLPKETLKKIYNLVDHNKDGFLRKDEFTVGMWLIDQCLYGRKLPKQVGDDIWDSVHNTAVVGVNISIGKKKKK